MRSLLSIIFFGVVAFGSLLAQSADSLPALRPDQDYLVTISTRLGDIKLVLYDETPLHKANFVKLANQKFYDGCTFHRIINNFMIQGGDPESKEGGNAANIGNGGPGYTIPAEFVPNLHHTKGKLAAARMGDHVNPTRASSGSQFYIVQNQRGTPHLDGQYTIFGEVVSGLKVVDAIAMRDMGNGMGTPRERIEMKVTVEVVSRAMLKQTYGYPLGK